MLEVKNLSVTYNGNIKALKSIDLKVEQGQIVVLIGANGAGKTTLLSALTGLVKVNPGGIAKLDLSQLQDIRTLNRMLGRKRTDVLLQAYGKENVTHIFERLRSDDDITSEIGKSASFVHRIRKIYKKYTTDDLLKIPSHECLMYGVAHVPEGRQVFANLTVEENLEMGAYKRHNPKKIKEDMEVVFERFPRLRERKKQRAGTLSGGEQQMLAMARAMMSKPKLLLLDEPSMGLSPIFVNEIFDIIKELNKQGTTILLVEQNANKALSIANYAYVLETGNIVLEGDGKELLNNDDVRKAYLGG